MATDLSSIKLEETDVPDETSAPEAFEELHCTVCGTGPLHYSGRGRKPTKCDEHKRGSGSASARGVSGGGRSNTSVKRAVDTIDQAYNLMGLGLMLMGLTGASAALAETAAAVKVQNVGFLEADPALVKMINKAGAAGGRAGFIAAQVMTLAPVVMLATAELKERRETRGYAPEG